MSGEHEQIRDAIGHEIMLWANNHEVDLRIVHTSSGAPEWDFRTTGKRGGSPNICLTRPTIFCHNGILTLKHSNSSTKFELADPRLIDQIKDHLARILRIQNVAT